MQPPRQLIVEPIGLDADALPRPIVWKDLFGNDNPIEIEIGMGKGTFLTDQARANPSTNFLGLEYARWFWRYASDRLRRNGCTNARTVRAEATYFFREFVPAETVSVIHIYFPDPWPKKRHHKRRLIQPPFIAQAGLALIRGGSVQIVTDHEEYFQQIQRVLEKSQLKIIDYTRPESAGAGELAGTNFERKYRREGRPFFAMAAFKNR
jgi:tRNA (guanine-N7-)-methyltransferase